ncbi:unnamed protein product [Soboliphyme baturini]|uniref:Uncharacterized protein n=1 Tax=Soboliphyme baturini TaxID=241478 RepID=A0A183IYK7_9BILA|nr:unnamed protein product [Soboliphyme baturini]
MEMPYKGEQSNITGVEVGFRLFISSWPFLAPIGVEVLCSNCKFRSKDEKASPGGGCLSRDKRETSDRVFEMEVRDSNLPPEDLNDAPLQKLLPHIAIPSSDMQQLYTKTLADMSIPDQIETRPASNSPQKAHFSGLYQGAVKISFRRNELNNVVPRQQLFRIHLSYIKTLIELAALDYFIQV